MKKRTRKAVKTISIDIDLLDRMEDYTDETGISISELIRRSAAFYLDVEEKAKEEK